MTKRHRARPSSSGEIPGDLERFLNFCVTATNPLEPDADKALVMADDGRHGGILCVLVGESNQDDIETLFATKPRRFAGWASTTGWAPDDFTPIEDSWVVLAVEGDLPVAAAVRPLSDPMWTRLGPNDLPWLYLSTAGTMRGWLNGKFDAPFKRTTDERLFRRPGEGEPPPTDAHGRI